MLDRRRFLALAGTCLSSPLLAGCGDSQGEELAPLPNTVKADFDVIVLGAGAAGLSAAWLLKDRCSVHVLEKNAHVGGKAISGHRNGFSFAKGTEYLGEPQGTLKTIIQRLGLRQREIPAPSDIHFQAGEFYYGDDGVALQMIQSSSLAQYNRFVKTIQDTFAQYKDIPDLDLKSNIAQLDNISVRQWFKQHQFPEIYHQIYNVSSKGLFGANIDEISALSFISELYFDFEHEAPIASIEELDNTLSQAQERTYTYTFETGIAEVTDALAKDLGKRVQLNAHVSTVTKTNGLYQVQYTDVNGASRFSTARVIIVATPAPIALQLAAPVLSEEQKSIMAQVHYAPYVTAALFSKEPIFNRGFDLAVPDGYFFTDVYDGTWVQRHYDTALGSKKDGIMSVYIAPQSYQDTALLAMSDAALLARVYQDLERIYPGVTGKIVGSELQRFQYAYPVMTMGAYQRLSRLHLISQGSLLLAGDYMIYPTFEAAVESGLLAHELALAALSKT